MSMAGEAVTIEVAGKVQGKGRARSFRRGDFTGHYTPKETRSYEGMIRFAAQEAMKGRGRFEGPVSVSVVVVFDIPVSYSKKKKAEALGGALWPTKKPDSDNLEKLVHDAMNTVVFKDDAQIVRSECTKKYGPAPKMVATVTPL
jgi:Holliday junction resolvase RusA-like endonuclease